MQKNIAVFLNWSRTFIEFSEFREWRESDKSLKHELGSTLRSCLHMCLAGTVGTSLSLTQEVASSSPYAVMTNIFVTEFSKNI